MICERCHGKGRVVQKATFYRGGKSAGEADEIGLCPLFYGTGTINCCEGDREQAMLSACNTDANPNEAS